MSLNRKMFLCLCVASCLCVSMAVGCKKIDPAKQGAAAPDMTQEEVVAPVEEPVAGVEAEAPALAAAAEGAVEAAVEVAPVAASPDTAGGPECYTLLKAWDKDTRKTHYVVYEQCIFKMKMDVKARQTRYIQPFQQEVARARGISAEGWRRVLAMPQDVATREELDALVAKLENPVEVKLAVAPEPSDVAAPIEAVAPESDMATP